MTPARQRWLAVILLAALLGPAFAAAEESGPFPVAFLAPAQADGDLGLHGTKWALLLFHGNSAHLGLDLGAASVRNQTWLEVRDPGGMGELPVAKPSLPEEFRTGIQGELAPAADWASLYIEADTLDFEMSGSHATLLPAEEGRYASDYLPPVPHPQSAVDQPPVGLQDGVGQQPYRHLLVPERSATFSVAGDTLGAPFRFTLHASGVTRLEWHNFTLSCPAACPDSGAPSSTSFSLLGETRLRRLSYIDVASKGGTVEGGGSVLAIVAGAGTLDATLNGTLRLPDAALDSQCSREVCPDGTTFQVGGAFLLSGLTVAPPGSARMQMQLAGRFDFALFDEAVAPGFTLAQTVAVGSALIVGGGCLVALGLFARSARLPALQHPRRQALHHLIQEEPGLSSRSLQRRLAWSRGTLLFHLKRLVEEGHVAAQPYKNTVRYFENHGRYADAWRKVVELRDPDASRLHEWLLAHPGVDQTGIVEETLGWGWDRNKVRRQLRNLQQAGLVEKQPAGRRVCYSAKASQVDGVPGPPVSGAHATVG